MRLVLIWAKPFTVIKAMNVLKYYLMHIFKRIAGLRVRVTGDKAILKEYGLFLISAHTGYLDGIVIGSLVPGSFTTKEEIRKLPLIGRVVAIGGSIFINRFERGKIVDYVNQMAERLREGINIFNFPEGHATNGTKILSFFPAFFDAPLKTRSPIVPVTIEYERLNGEPIANRDDVYCYDGKISIIQHLWNLLKYKSIDISVHVHSRIELNGFKSDRVGRKSVSDLCIQRLSTYKNLPIDNDHPFKKRSRLDVKT